MASPIVHDPRKRAALAGIAVGKQTAWDVLAAEALADKCFGKGCAVELPTARARRLAQIGARKAEAKERAAAKRRRGRRKRR